MTLFFLVLVQSHPSAAVVIMSLIPLLLTLLVAAPAVFVLWSSVSVVGSGARPDLVHKTLSSMILSDVADVENAVITAPHGFKTALRMRPASSVQYRASMSTDAIGKTPSPVAAAPAGYAPLSRSTSVASVRLPSPSSPPLPPPPFVQPQLQGGALSPTSPTAIPATVIGAPARAGVNPLGAMPKAGRPAPPMKPLPLPQTRT